MNQEQWIFFNEFKSSFKQKINEWNIFNDELMDLQKKAAQNADNVLYSFETPIVYNRDLDKITQEDEIKLIVIGDNPGKDEQLQKNNRYLVGQAGKLADSFFKKNPSLNIDFRKNVIILNKTPVHSAKTNQLKFIIKNASLELKKMILESQIWMAQNTAKLHAGLVQKSNKNNFPELWLVGYSELKKKGIFEDYKNFLKTEYDSFPLAWEKVFVFQHFSMNRFSIDLNKHIKENNLQNQDLFSNIHKLGNIHKAEMFLV